MSYPSPPLYQMRQLRVVLYTNHFVFYNPYSIRLYRPVVVLNLRVLIGSFGAIFKESNLRNWLIRLDLGGYFRIINGDLCMKYLLFNALVEVVGYRPY